MNIIQRGLQTISKAKQIIDKSGFNQFLMAVLNRAILKLPIGNKIMHRPYHILPKSNFPLFYDQLNPKLCHFTCQLSEAKVLLLCDTSKLKINSLIDVLKLQCQHLDITEPQKIGFFSRLSQYKAIFIYQLPINYKLRQILQSAHNYHIPIFLWLDELKPSQAHLQSNDYADFILTADSSIVQAYKQEQVRILNVNLGYSPSDIAKVFAKAIKEYESIYFPQITIISLLPELIDKTALKDCLQSYINQSYQGKIEVILVGSDSTLIDQDILVKYNLEFQFSYSIEKALELANGDLVIFTKIYDSLSQNYLVSHAFAHAYQDCDISMGHSTKCPLRDPVNPNSFINLRLDYLGVRKKWLQENLDIIPLLSDYNDNSNIDIELGYKLYQIGGRLQFVKDASALSSPQNTLSDICQFQTQLLDLSKKYPESSLVLRKFLSKQDVNITPRINSKPRTLKILTYPWHIPHQYELYKLPHEFTLVTDAGTGYATGWNLQNRPIPDNAIFKSIRDINIQDYDLAILHFDENVLTPENSKGHISRDWGDSFKFFREKIDLPKVAICHGTPQFYGQYDLNYDQPNLLETIESEREKFVTYLDDILVINNSHQAQKEWNFQKSKVIWHGFDPTEFPPTTYFKGILTPFGEAMTSRPHYRGYRIYKSVFKNFPPEYSPSVLSVREPHILLRENQYAQVRFRNYVDDIRQYSIYFNPTIRSPMPRSRGEAMMCGLVTVSLKNHDVELFLDNGVNGFYADTDIELREILLYLLQNPQETRKIGQKGRELAMDIFNHDRYLKVWQETLLDLI